MDPQKGKTFSWSSALIGAASASAVAALLILKPKDPGFDLASIKFSALKIHLPPALHTDLILTIHICNPNAAPIEYNPTSLSIFYDGALLGTAPVDGGSQGSKACRILRLSARLQLPRSAGKFAADVARRRMELDAEVDIEGEARLVRGWWGKRFRVHVESRIAVDPVTLDVLDQENKAKMKMF